MLIFVIAYLNIGIMGDIKLMNEDLFDVDTEQLGCCYYAINRDENFEENYEEPNFIGVENFEGCYDPDFTTHLR